MILYGAPVVEKLKTRIKKLIDHYHVKPILASITIGDVEAAESYNRSRIKLANELGIEIMSIRFDPNTTDIVYVYNAIARLNSDKNVHGIILQLPLPEKWSPHELLLRNAIDPKKDVDAIREDTLGLIHNEAADCIPCTAGAVLAMLDHYQIPIDGKHIVMVGRSRTVGMPLQILLTQLNATVSLCHSHTPEDVIITLASIADIVILATGKPHYWDASDFPHTTVIDIGTTMVDGHLQGDFNPAKAETHFTDYSPVPGGIGPVTAATLMLHTTRNAVEANM